MYFVSGFAPAEVSLNIIVWLLDFLVYYLFALRNALSIYYFVEVQIVVKILSIALFKALFGIVVLFCFILKYVFNLAS